VTYLLLIYANRLIYWVKAYCNRTTLLLAAWLPARLVTSCLQNAHALKRDKTGKKRVEQSWGNRSSVCVQVTGERMWDSVYVLSVVKWILQLRYDAED
jgi:hypothetical protein